MARANQAPMSFQLGTAPDGKYFILHDKDNAWHEFTKKGKEWFDAQGEIIQHSVLQLNYSRVVSHDYCGGRPPKA